MGLDRKLQLDLLTKIAECYPFEWDDYERNVDKLEDELREKHIQRLSKGKCEPESGVVFLDLISNLERIADHATNIAGYVVSESRKPLPALDEE